MKKPYLIQSATDEQGRFWAASQEAEMDYSVGWFHKGSDIPVRVSKHAGLGSTLSRIKDMAAYDLLAIDWSSLKIPVGELIVAQSETKGAAREEVRVFHTQAAYDAFRRDRLEEYEADDQTEVEGLLESGNLDLAWTVALDDGDGPEKTLWDTYFGSHYVERMPNMIAFTTFPAGIKTPSKTHCDLAVPYRKYCARRSRPDVLYVGAVSASFHPRLLFDYRRPRSRIPKTLPQPKRQKVRAPASGQA